MGGLGLGAETGVAGARLSLRAVAGAAVRLVSPHLGLSGASTGSCKFSSESHQSHTGFSLGSPWRFTGLTRATPDPPRISSVSSPGPHRPLWKCPMKTLLALSAETVLVFVSSDPPLKCLGLMLKSCGAQLLPCTGPPFPWGCAGSCQRAAGGARGHQGVEI